MQGRSSFDDLVFQDRSHINGSTVVRDEWLLGVGVEWSLNMRAGVLARSLSVLLLVWVNRSLEFSS